MTDAVVTDALLNSERPPRAAHRSPDRPLPICKEAPPWALTCSSARCTCPPTPTLDLEAARATVSRLCATASLDELRILLDNDWLPERPATNLDWAAAHWDDAHLSAHADQIRAATEQCLHQLLDALAASLRHRDVARLRLSTGLGGDADGSTGVDAYLTGGLSWGDSPTHSYTSWDLVYDCDKFPDGWSDSIATAAGLLYPSADGPPVRTITFSTWA